MPQNCTLIAEYEHKMHYFVKVEDCTKGGSIQSDFEEKMINELKTLMPDKVFLY